MAYTLKWSDQSLQDLLRVKFYISYFFGLKSWLKFLKKFARTINHISESPYSFPLFSDYDKTRKCTGSKRCATFFSIEQDEVHIHTLFDMRQNPERLKRLLEE